MEPHHAESIRNLVQAFAGDPSVRALLLGGSLAHGFARPDSDIDVAIVLTDEEFARRRAEGKLHYNNRTLCTYPGYIDGKYMDEAFLHQVAERGSEPARYAFQGAQILISHLNGLDTLLRNIVRYPATKKTERISRFASQLIGWRWFYSEGVRQDNAYLRQLAVQKSVLFSCRIVLTANELLFPYHKWMLRVTLAAPRLPADFAASLDRVMTAPSFDVLNAHCLATLTFARLDPDAVNAGWPTHFLQDTELRWQTETPAIDDW